MQCKPAGYAPFPSLNAIYELELHKRWEKLKAFCIIRSLRTQIQLECVQRARRYDVNDEVAFRFGEKCLRKHIITIKNACWLTVKALLIQSMAQKVSWRTELRTRKGVT
jgi:hypothetical protein